MKRIGLIGGMSWESSLEYYRLINTFIKEELGETHSADLLMYSFDFDYIEKLQHQGDWKKLTDVMIEEASNLKLAGAKGIVICTNTMHKMASDIVREVDLPVIHIAEATAQSIAKKNIDKVLLLGTKFTMESNFYHSKLEEQGIEVIIPSTDDRKTIHDVIYGELIFGKLLDSSRTKFVEIINKSQELGCKGVVLGCTEIPLLINDDDVNIEVFDTTTIHSRSVVKFMLDIWE